MTAIILALIIGIVCTVLKLLPRRVIETASNLTMLGAVTLITSMGARIGLDPKLMTDIALFGGQALILALGAVVGSVLVVWGLERMLLQREDLSSDAEELALAQMIDLEGAVQQKVNHTVTYLIVSSLAAGITLGYGFLPKAVEPALGAITDWALYFTIWTVGLDLGRSGKTLRKIGSMGWKVFLAPLGVALGSILGSAIGGILLGFPLNEASAVGAGFGWYSLSGVLLSQIYSVKIGAIAFLSNVFRELIAVISIPYLARKVGPLAAVAPGGATAMDTTLPVIAASAGSHTALIGFVSGLCLTTVVPFLVPILIKL